MVDFGIVIDGLLKGVDNIRDVWNIARSFTKKKG
jgi:hypothetical protein